jgi:hypothetical protein
VAAALLFGFLLSPAAATRHGRRAHQPPTEVRDGCSFLFSFSRVGILIIHNSCSIGFYEIDTMHGRLGKLL